MARFDHKIFNVDYAGHTQHVEDLSGWRCQSCGEVEFDAGSAKRYAAAGDTLVLRERERQGQEIRRIRQKLGLTQRQAARLTGGGHNAFSRYERGEAAPLAAVVNLFRLLDKNPALLNDLAESRRHREPAGRRTVGTGRRRSKQQRARRKAAA